MTPSEAIKRLEILLNEEIDNMEIYAKGTVKNIQALKMGIEALKKEPLLNNKAIQEELLEKRRTP